MGAFAALSLLLAQGQVASFDAEASWVNVSGAIGSRYYARAAQKNRMESMFAKYGPRATQAKDVNSFADVVNAMITDFGDSHFGLFTQSDQGFYVMDGLIRQNSARPMPNFGAWFQKDSQGDSYTVQMVLNGTAAAKADLRKGDVMVSVNSERFSPVDSLKGAVGKTVKLTVRRGSRTLTKDVEVDSKPAMEVFLQASKDSTRVIEQGGKKFGYFHLWTQANESFKTTLANAVYGQLKGTDAFILDLRDGFGGRPEGYADPFFRPESTLEWDFGGAKNTQLFGYQRPLVVLINKGSRSAKEVLSFILQKSKRATLIGIRTGGNVLGTSPMPMGDWGYLEIPMVDVITDGVRLEKVGVSPDIAVKEEYDSEGNDLVLREALAFLTKRR